MFHKNDYFDHDWIRTCSRSLKKFVKSDTNSITIPLGYSPQMDLYANINSPNIGSEYFPISLIFLVPIIGLAQPKQFFLMLNNA